MSRIIEIYIVYIIQSSCYQYIRKKVVLHPQTVLIDILRIGPDIQIATRIIIDTGSLDIIIIDLYCQTSVTEYVHIPKCIKYGDLSRRTQGHILHASYIAADTPYAEPFSVKADYCQTACSSYIE